MRIALGKNVFPDCRKTSARSFKAAGYRIAGGAYLYRTLANAPLFDLS
jgi:hypothetical protein